MFNIAFGLSGNGSTFEAIQTACENQHLNAQIKIVFSDNLTAYGISRAEKHSIATLYTPSSILKNNATTVLKIFNSLDINLICLGGFLKKIPHEIIQRYPKRILNSHPSLLPKFGGKGMYGAKVHEAVLASGEKETGCTIHFVDENYDTGQIILQKKIPVLPNDTQQTLHDRLIIYEHQAYIEAIQLIQTN